MVMNRLWLSFLLIGLLPAAFTYQEASSFRHPHRVQNIVPGDFTHSGKLDILVMSESQTKGQLDMILYPASLAGGFDIDHPLRVPSSTLSQPIPIDANGDLKIDLLSMTPASKDDPKAPFQLWQNVWNSSQPDSPLFNMCVPRSSAKLTTAFLTEPPASRPDSMARSVHWPIRIVTLLSTLMGTALQLFVRFPLSALLPDSLSLLVLDTTYAPPIPLSLKLGDVNLDGFPDILLITGSGKDRIPSLVLSKPCAAGMVGCSANGMGRRGWEVAKSGADPLSTIKDARSVAFLDVDEDVNIFMRYMIPVYSVLITVQGTLDIMVQRTGDAGHGNVIFVQNNYYYDAFFLKAIGRPSDDWTIYLFLKPFGVSYSGASYKYTVLDTSGHRSAAQVGQLPQTSYHALQTPYSFFGLGRTNNYIENLFVGSTVHTDWHYINMEGVIPNSKVVILPSANEGEAWKRELFLRPGEWIPWVTVTVVAGTVVLAIIVFVLHLNEKACYPLYLPVYLAHVTCNFSQREDELERRRASHHINFDAL
ncbi:hypothetical protein C0992_005022 [Termitomyces sp. T32_za158]|nr:hypothetical protein C0992_005022 [Termitomyces sp. T32_za158]